MWRKKANLKRQGLKFKSLNNNFHFSVFFEFLNIKNIKNIKINGRDVKKYCLTENFAKLLKEQSPKIREFLVKKFDHPQYKLEYLNKDGVRFTSFLSFTTKYKPAIGMPLNLQENGFLSAGRPLLFSEAFEENIFFEENKLHQKKELNQILQAIRETLQNISSQEIS